jgi:hypothetical protein
MILKIIKLWKLYEKFWSLASNIVELKIDGQKDVTRKGNIRIITIY